MTVNVLALTREVWCIILSISGLLVRFLLVRFSDCGTSSVLGFNQKSPFSSSTSRTFHLIDRWIKISCLLVHIQLINNQLFPNRVIVVYNLLESLLLSHFI